uniref:Transmembrane protein 25 n=1 Tax=Varanus komodoensis TaxID=61221 RepID=A0A8D2JDS6_VARKO
DGGAEPEAAGDGRVFSCRAAAPSLAWYLDGVRPQRNGSGKLLAAGEESGRGAFEVTLDRQLNCSATDPRGRVSSASVLLNVQFKPELVRMDAGYAEAREPGLLLVLLVLVQANPPANITWVDQDGQVMVSTSTFLLVDTKTYPWPTNHTVQVQLSSLVQNLSSSAATDVGRTPSSVLLPALLDARIELPLLALVGVSVAALGALLCLGACISCVVYQKGRKALRPLHHICSLTRDSDDPRPTATRLPRTIMSLPSNLQLNDLPPESKALNHSTPSTGRLLRSVPCLCPPGPAQHHPGLVRFFKKRSCIPTPACSRHQCTPGAQEHAEAVASGKGTWAASQRRTTRLFVQDGGQLVWAVPQP